MSNLPLLLKKKYDILLVVLCTWVLLFGIVLNVFEESVPDTMTKLLVGGVLLVTFIRIIMEQSRLNSLNFVYGEIYLYYCVSSWLAAVTLTIVSTGILT